MQNIKLKTKDDQTPSSQTIDSSKDLIVRSIVKESLIKDPSINCGINKDHNSVDSHVKSPRLASYLPHGIFGCLAMK